MKQRWSGKSQNFPQHIEPREAPRPGAREIRHYRCKNRPHCDWEDKTDSFWTPDKCPWCDGEIELVSTGEKERKPRKEKGNG